MTRVRFALLLCVATLWLPGGCNDEAAKNSPPPGVDSTHVTTSSITDVLSRHTPKLMSIPGVVGTAQGEEDGRPCIVVYVKEETDSLVIAIPSSLEGFSVRIQAVGEITPQH
jgi:hypothetical protein